VVSSSALCRIEITPPLPDPRRLPMQTDVALLIAPLEFALEEFPQQRVVAAGIRPITDRYE
jgi:hypothetical protein